MKEVISSLSSFIDNVIQEQYDDFDGGSINEFFKYLEENKDVDGTAHVYYVSSQKTLKTNANGEINQNYGKIYKHQDIEFRLGDTYKKTMLSVDPEHKFGERSGSFEKIENFNLLESGKSGLYLPVLPKSKTYEYTVSDDGKTHKPIQKEEVFKFLSESKGGEKKVEYNQLVMDKVYGIKLGGKLWKNPNFLFSYAGKI